MKVRISQAISMASKFLRAKLVPMVAGSPALGKSAIAKHIAKEYKLKLIDLRLSQCDPTEIMGFPKITGERAGYIPMETFPIEGDPIPEGYNGWLLFLDELNSASNAVQAAAYKLILDRMVGLKHLHTNVGIMCAGNLESDNAIVNTVSTALQSRLVHMELVVNIDDWTAWANANGVDHRITDFIAFKPNSLYTFQPDHTDSTYASPRTWEFADKVLKVTDELSEDTLPMLAGTLGEGVAREFLIFCKIYQTLPTINQILTDPDGTNVPKELSTLFALAGSLSQHTTMDTHGKIMKYLVRLPVEFQVVSLKTAIRRDMKLMSHPDTQAWLDRVGTTLF